MRDSSSNPLFTTNAQTIVTCLMGQRMQYVPMINYVMVNLTGGLKMVNQHVKVGQHYKC